MDLETIICFEVHVELNTKSKLFCGCPTGQAETPNTRICPVCTGQPGALPVLNQMAVEHCVRAGLALHCRINRRARFARKNYFYPDLPKGYQISQYEQPFCEDGYLEIIGDDGSPYPVGIKRIHMEEDAGKLVHSADNFESSTFSLVDYNRSSVPLLEIVADHTRNPLRSVNEARRYLEKLRQILRYIGVSECIIERGQFRCDVNVSVRPRGEAVFGNRSEVKNMASFRFITEALEYEIKRQSEILASGQEARQETRLFDESKKTTLPMRSKEDAPDYRYFPDPDLIEIDLDDGFIQSIRDTLSELPDEKVQRFVEHYGIPPEDALVLTKDRAVSEFFEGCAALCEDPRRLSRWIIKDLFMHLKEASLSIEACPIPPAHFAKLMNLIHQGEITDPAGRTILQDMFTSGEEPAAIIERRDLRAIQDDEILGKMAEQVLQEHPKAVERVRQGHAEAIHFLIGQIMKKTKGRADPKKVDQMIRKKMIGP
jgi:aspartyl-tRNA(Asn)/glutamyl-tRNA(Gln) amidotransferase subunit B